MDFINYITDAMCGQPTSWFSPPDGQSILYAYQNLLAACVALLAASIGAYAAYRASTHSDRSDALKRGQYYYATLTTLKVILEGFKETHDSDEETFYIPFSCKEHMDRIDFDIFSYEYTYSLSQKEVSLIPAIKIAVDTLCLKVKDYEGSFGKIYKVEDNENIVSAQEGIIKSADTAIKVIKESFTSNKNRHIKFT